MSEITAEAAPAPVLAAPPARPTSGSAAPLHAASHLPALDGLRGLAILLVLFFHLPSGESLAGIAPRLFLALRAVGWSGVDLFFVLSGFLITGILFDARRHAHYFRNFYMRRSLRIFPLYYGYLAVVLLLLPALGVRETAEGPLRFDGQWSLWAYAANLHAAVAGTYSVLAAVPFTGHFWSLAIEEQFYLFWPALVRAFNRAALARAAVVIVFAALAFRLAAWMLGANPLVPYLVTVARIDGFAVGCLLALAARGPEGLGALRRAARVMLPASIPVLLLLAAVYHRIVPLDFWTATVGLTALAVFWGGVLALAASGGPSSPAVRVFGSAAMRWVGKYSYAIYVLHMPVNLFFHSATPLHQRWWVQGTIPTQLLYFAVTTAVTFTCAWLSWHLYEKHFLQLKRFFPYS